MLFRAPPVLHARRRFRAKAARSRGGIGRSASPAVPQLTRAGVPPSRAQSQRRLRLRIVVDRALHGERWSANANRVQDDNFGECLDAAATCPARMNATAEAGALPIRRTAWMHPT